MKQGREGWQRWLLCVVAMLAAALTGSLALAQGPAPAAQEYRLGPGDGVKISVFQNPDLGLETRVSETGVISYPLVGSVQVGGLTVGEAEKAIAAGLRSGGYVLQPQVTLVVQQVRGAQVAVLGQVARPGRYPLESTAMKVTDALALAGGTTPQGAEKVILTGLRNGRRVRLEVDVADLFVTWTPEKDVPVQAGDTLYVQRAPQFYVYGEVLKAGAYRVERNMTVLQALSLGGGLNPRGTERGIRIHRRGDDGSVRVINPQLNDPVQADDVIVVREALF
ncbi:MAG TPA: polysaccharide export protein EpsE [Rhodocyclaceae bacterium]|uniref:polysaccharide export protein EpsE n=1 Tax=Zoogloea sp. TaxID=49181 RepID=UPI002C109EDE|nr:polysaccharide export protein EpsE [Zoogloea sp.]HMV64660.1 polysaccharide export protein EpsE [Rhodocyclaceae bacterium]HMW53234.1 polysaccharide export protein EpsE [Rhodocyclaceae bacterium]HNA67009.1 polysaccharide export protein EpsE [Rhodocyclaceae bacterium]HNC77882.1 polysaccharide export protein EpsE [Rhodocyclaceae bacterium]HNE16264.1 polysaccharide export protein EpsE [Rhodocyclaceae bacterium]